VGIINKHDYVLCRENIKLRPMTDDDFEILLKWNSDSDVLYWVEGDDIDSHSLADIQGIYGSVSQNAWCFIIEFSGTPVGECWLQKMNMPHIIEEFPDDIIYRIDIMIGDKNYWNQGIGTRVIRMLTDFGFKKQKADKIFYLPGDYNKRSIRAAEKVGYIIHALIAVEENHKAKYDVNMMMTRIGYSDLYDL
jgi:Acetyltransferases, including N-acetylases of ribosomal proteins